MAMVSEIAYNGLKKLNPFKFQHFGLEKVNILNDGQTVWEDGLSFDWAQGFYLRGYFEMQRVLDYMNSDNKIDVTCHAWDQSFFSICVNLKEAKNKSTTSELPTGNVVP